VHHGLNRGRQITRDVQLAVRASVQIFLIHAELLSVGWVGGRVAGRQRCHLP
jgi:hypothetical protein